nr:hypothetical protein [Microbacterium sp. MEC084]
MNAAWYSTADCAAPATSHPIPNTTGSGARATIMSPPAPAMLPTVIAPRGPRSRMRPTGTPRIAEAMSPSENSAVTRASGHPVSSEIAGAATMSA